MSNDRPDYAEGLAELRGLLDGSTTARSVELPTADEILENCRRLSEAQKIVEKWTTGLHLYAYTAPEAFARAMAAAPAVVQDWVRWRGVGTDAFRPVSRLDMPIVPGPWFKPESQVKKAGDVFYPQPPVAEET